MATLAPNNKTADDYWKEIQDNRSGSFGEGMISKAKQIMDGLKAQVSNGQRSLTSYYTIAEQLMPRISNVYNSIAGGGSKAATAANNAGGQTLMSTYTQRDSAGNLAVKLPFTRTEYAALSNDVLPTQDDVTKGFWDPTIAPISRFKTGPATTTTPTTPQVNPGLTPTPTTPATPTAPTLPSAPQTTQTPYGGLQQENTPGGIDAQKLLAEAELAKTLQEQTVNQQTAARKKMLEDLGVVLKQKQLDSFNQAIPDLAEQANTKGIFRSTGFGDILANKYTQLERDTSNQLAELGITEGRKDIDALGNIESDYLSGRNTALSRQFSLDDFQRNIQIAKELGTSTAPTVPTKTTGQKWAEGIGTATGVAGTAAAVGKKAQG